MVRCRLFLAREIRNVCPRGRASLDETLRKRLRFKTSNGPRPSQIIESDSQPGGWYPKDRDREPHGDGQGQTSKGERESRGSGRKVRRSGWAEYEAEERGVNLEMERFFPPRLGMRNAECRQGEAREGAGRNAMDRAQFPSLAGGNVRLLRCGNEDLFFSDGLCGY